MAENGESNVLNVEKNVHSQKDINKQNMDRPLNFVGEVQNFAANPITGAEFLEFFPLPEQPYLKIQWLDCILRFQVWKYWIV